MIKISVIIPVHNKEKYLRQCLDSVIHQTLEDIEIICLEDDSTDNSFEILKEYAQKDSRFIVRELKVQNAAKVRNAGIEIAKGEFIAFMDADDFYPSNDVLETLYNKAIENNVMICGGEFSTYQESDKSYFSDFNGKFDGYKFKNDELIKYCDYQFDYGFTRFIYNREFLARNNFKFDNFSFFEDPPFFVKVMVKAEKFYAVNKISYVYRQAHKDIFMSEQNVKDLILALLQNLRLSKELKYKKLAKYTTERFKDFFKIIKIKQVVYNLPFFISLIKADNRILCILLYEVLYARIAKFIFCLTKINGNKVLTILGLRLELK